MNSNKIKVELSSLRVVRGAVSRWTGQWGRGTSLRTDPKKIKKNHTHTGFLTKKLKKKPKKTLFWGVGSKFFFDRKNLNFFLFFFIFCEKIFFGPKVDFCPFLAIFAPTPPQPKKTQKPHFGGSDRKTFLTKKI